jgi:hypothetical protein
VNPEEQRQGQTPVETIQQNKVVPFVPTISSTINKEKDRHIKTNREKQSCYDCDDG